MCAGARKPCFAYRDRERRHNMRMQLGPHLAASRIFDGFPPAHIPLGLAWVRQGWRQPASLFKHTAWPYTGQASLIIVGQNHPLFCLPVHQSKCPRASLLLIQTPFASGGRCSSLLFRASLVLIVPPLSPLSIICWPQGLPLLLLAPYSSLA